MQPAKTVAAIHDLSGAGRCALTVAIPVLSAMGAQVCPAPTAVLSTHTAFPEPAIRDLTDFLRPVFAHWQALGLRFDAVYAGYLFSPAQAEIVGEFLRAQPKALKIIDPVLGDGGRMYRALDPSMPAAMRALCREADLITPNLTEYALLTGEPYDEAARTADQATAMLQRLLKSTGARAALITSLPVGDGPVNACMDAAGRVSLIPYVRQPASFPGTGDLFASVVTGALMSGAALDEAVRRAADFVGETIAVTLACGTEPRLGVQLEKTLSHLIS